MLCLRVLLACRVKLWYSICLVCYVQMFFSTCYVQFCLLAVLRAMLRCHRHMFSAVLCWGLFCLLTCSLCCDKERDSLFLSLSILCYDKVFLCCFVDAFNFLLAMILRCASHSACYVRYSYLTYYYVCWVKSEGFSSMLCYTCSLYHGLFPYAMFFPLFVL